jgi:hypothetical protein
MLMELRPQGGLAAIFAYGRALSVTGLDGTTQTITRPGWEETVAGPGAAPSEPCPAPPGTIARLLALLDGLPGRHGGARTIPTDAGIAGSVPYAGLSQVPAGPPDEFGPPLPPPVDALPPVPIGGRGSRTGNFGGGQTAAIGAAQAAMRLGQMARRESGCSCRQPRHASDHGREWGE